MNENKPIIAERIKSLRKEKGFTQEQLAEVLGLNAKSSIANYESGANAPSDEIKKKMCNLFNCSMDYLMGNSEFKTKEDELQCYLFSFLHASSFFFEYSKLADNGFSDTEISQIENIISAVPSKFNFEEAVTLIDNFSKTLSEEKQKVLKNVLKNDFQHLDNYLLRISNSKDILETVNNIKSEVQDYFYYSKDANFYMCPVYGQIPAGEPNWAEECIEGRLPIDPNMMNIVDPEQCYFLRVNGESMNKVIANGAYALIRKTDWVENGEIAVVLVNGYDATLKKFTKQGDLVILEPMSSDPTIQTQVYNKDTSIKIIGKYIGKFEMKN